MTIQSRKRYNRDTIGKDIIEKDESVEVSKNNRKHYQNSVNIHHLPEKNYNKTLNCCV